MSSATAARPGRAAATKKRLGLGLNYPRRGVKGWTRWLPSWQLLLFAFLVLAVLGLGAFGVGYATTKIPEPNVAAAGSTSTVYYDDGETELGSFTVEDRRPVTIDEISEPMKQAAIAAEDQSFYENRGISFKGISRAAWGIVTDDYAGGGSTITQQYVKNFYLTNERSLDRKVREMFIALKIDQELSKDQILANYLNTIYLGRQSYGVEVASRNYFDKSAKDLDLAESALLAAMIQRPGAADPEENPEEYEARFQYVLDSMAKLGYITEDEAANTEMPEFRSQKKSNQWAGQNGYLLETIRTELIDSGLTEDELNRGGLEIVSTFNKRMVDDAVKAAENLPELKDGMHVGLTSIDPKTGEIKAIYGGPDYLKRSRNAATQDTMQAGSTFKPFTLVAGLENGYRLNEYFTGRSGTTFNYDGSPWTVRNYGGSNYGSVSLLKATQSSVNTAYAQLNIEVGPEKTVDVATRAGLGPKTVGLQPNASNVLGTASPTVKDMASAFSTFAANGVYRAPHAVRVATDKNGEEIYKPDTEGERHFDKNVMAETTYALSRVVTGGSGSYARNLGRPAAGKTGTSQANYSAWFVGYTPQLATAVSMYREDEAGNPVAIGSYGGRGSITGGSFPTMMWTDYMKAALEGTDVEQFPERGELPKVEKPNHDSGVPKQRAPKRTSQPKPDRQERPRQTQEPKPEETEEPAPTQEPKPEDPKPTADPPKPKPEDPKPTADPPKPKPQPSNPGGGNGSGSGSNSGTSSDGGSLSGG